MVTSAQEVVFRRRRKLGELHAARPEGDMVDRSSHRAAAIAAASGNVVGQYSDRCCVAPSPELAERWKAELTTLRSRTNIAFAQSLGITRTPRRLGFDDGYIIPATEFELGAPLQAISFAAAERAPLRGNVRVAVVLVEFSDHPMKKTTSHFNDLFFSTGVLPHGSVQEYYTEVTNGLVTLTGEVVGPYRMPKTLAFYANNNFGIGRGPGESRVQQLAYDAAVLADPGIDFAPYDNDGNGFVDAFIVVHAGVGGEASGNPGDIWSHKWTLPRVYNADGTKIFGYLTIPEDAKIGVSAHELGHLLFGFPDLYDTDYTSEGVGNWCLMGGGSWNGGGDIPAHPSAWCKVNQGWASVTNVTKGGSLKLADVKSSHDVHRLWKDGGSGAEYFLIENRQRTGYDSELPGDGLLVWHIDENQPDNTDENHYKVGLLQADGNRDLELNGNRGDAGDPYPGSSKRTSATNDTTPSTTSFAGQDTDVSITKISASASTMTATVSVTSGGQLIKDVKDITKDNVKDGKKVAKQARKASSRTTTGTQRITRGARRRSTT
jgi:immune inhibitor A